MYKLSLTINKAIHHNSPDYLASLLHLQIPIYNTPDPFLQHRYPYHSPFTQTPFFKFTLLCPLCPLPLELPTQTPTNKLINSLLKTPPQDSLLLPCLPSHSIISIPRTADC